MDVGILGDLDGATKDYTNWSSEEGPQAAIGAAVHYEEGETGSSAANGSFLRWTIDGSIEQHGPHLPLSTDVIISEAMARAGGERLSADGYEVVLLPITDGGSGVGRPVARRPVRRPTCVSFWAG